MRFGKRHEFSDNPNGCGPAFVKKYAWFPTRLHDGAAWIWREHYWARYVDLGNLWPEYQWERRALDDTWVQRVGTR